MARGVRPRIKKSTARRSTPTLQDYALRPTAHPATSRRGLNVPLVLLPNGRAFTQETNLPTRPGQVDFQGDRIVSEQDVQVSDRQNPAEGNNTEEVPLFPGVSPSKHRAKRQAQGYRWEHEILPVLVPVYMEFMRRTDSLREEGELLLRKEPCTCCVSRTLSIWVYRFTKFERIEVFSSTCSPAATQLVQSGLFPCAPFHPTLAVDIRVLDFVRRLFLHVAPNHTAWCNTATDFLSAQGYRLPGDDPLRRRFANALQWFVSLVDLTTSHVDQRLLEVRASIIPEASGPGASVGSGEADSEPEGEQYEQHAGPSRKRQRGSSELDDEMEANGAADDNSPGSPPLERPSEYLRARCPLCFGGASAKDVIVCVDACFTQKHNAKGPRDYARTHPASFYVPEQEVHEWKQWTDSVRFTDGTKPSRKKKQRRAATPDGEPEEDEDDDVEEGMRVPKHVLNGCEASFTAADEARVKGSTQFFDVTAKMALLCRHDRPLWVVNMNTAGEGQHYTLVLVWKLFENLPLDFSVNLLYDIGCQLHRSCIKWGFLAPYLTRLRFTVSIFHAFGHQWACQLVYHPRKCIGYGLSDGEGAERLWHALSRLIAYGRVAGYYLRMYNLDSQLTHMNNEGLSKLGAWLQRKHRACLAKLGDAEAELRDCGVSEEVLRREWTAQIAAQTKPLPRQEKNKGKKTVEEVIRLRKARDTLAQRVTDLQKRISNEFTAPWDVAIAELEIDSVRASLKKAEEKVLSKERALGVTERNDLRHLVTSPFLHKRMNARALKTRILRRLRDRKFELDRLERSYRKQRSEQRINDHTEDSVKRRDPGIMELARKYNRLCADMVRLVETRRAPHGAIAPPEIDAAKLFSLDVDDDIWLDIGLDDAISGTPPAWLASEPIRSGIRALLDRDRCREELQRIESERNAMQEWFSEEWRVVSECIELENEESYLVYHLRRRQRTLSRLYVTWERVIEGLLCSEDLPEWGPSEGEKMQARAEMWFGHGVVIPEIDGDYDPGFEEEVDVLMTEHLESLTISNNYRDLEQREDHE